MIRALVVDDEAPARSELCFLLEEIGNVDIVGEASNVREAVTLIKSTPADVIFLDVNMPGFTGIQLAESLATHPKPPAIIFVTAHSEHAVKAFEVNAIDYLIKPVEQHRLEVALAKISGAGPAVHDANDAARIMVNKAGKKLFITTDEITYVMAKDDYSYIYTDTDRFLSTSSLTSLEEKLTVSGFFRVHRRYLVNLKRIRSVAPQQGGTLILTLEDRGETEVPVSRRRVAGLKKAIGL